MFELPHTLRFRLSGYFLLLFGLLLIGLWVIIDLIVNAHLHDRFDAELLHRAQTVADSLDADDARRSGSSFRERVLAAVKPFEADHFFFEVRSAATGEVVQSSNVRGFRLPDAGLAVDSAGPRRQTVIGETADALCGQGCHLRVVGMRIESSDLPYSLRAAASLAPLQRTLGLIRRSLLISIVVSLAAAGLASWIVAGRSLAPLERIAARAKGLTADHLDQRLPAPTQGDEVASMIAAINEMLTRFEQQFKNQQRFISNVSHELRTPLAVLRVEVQMQRRLMAHRPELTEFFNSLEEEVARLLQMVESFLILTRARIHRRLESVADVSVEDVVVRAIQEADKNARVRDVRVVPRFSSEEGASEPLISGDADLLGTAFRNLLSNAVRHSPQGQTVEVDLHATAEQVEVSVRDRGPGIPEEHHPHLFDMFYQVATRSGGSAGVGLAIVKTVVELHGGTVAVENLKGGGCQFTVRLPALSTLQPRALQPAVG